MFQNTSRVLAAAASLAVLASSSGLAADSSTSSAATHGPAAAEVRPSMVKVVGGVVQPKTPLIEAIANAILFLRKGDGAYVPGNITGELAGYFMSATVQADGSRRTGRTQLSFPARQHAYFIRAFLHYYAYTGEQEWLLRARDLAEWNIATSTPTTDVYANLPYSAHQNGKPTGSADRNSIETDKPAFLGSAYLALYESTEKKRYLEAARRIAATLVATQRADGSWPFRVLPKDGTIYQDFGGAPVFFVEFFDDLNRHEPKPEYVRARDNATRLMIVRNVEQGEWGTYHEDIRPSTNRRHLSAEPMSFTAGHFFARASAHPEYLEMGKRVLRQMEDNLVFSDGHAAAPAPAVAEQKGFAHIMAGHTARYCMALARLYSATGDEAVKRRAMSALNALTYMQNEHGLFRTHFYDTVRKTEKNPATAPNWYSQHLYTIRHVLECMAAFPEVAPDGQDHILGFSTMVRDPRYAPGNVSYATVCPSIDTLKLSFSPQSVELDGRPLAPNGANGDGWRFDPSRKVLVVRHGVGRVTVSR